MTARAKVVADCYVDSVRLLEATRAMLEAPGVDWAWALMATPANLEVLFDEGVTEGLDSAAANDLVLAVKGTDENLPAALLRAWAVLFEETGSAGAGAPPDARPAGLDDALVSAPEANVAIVSVPGPYAALEAHKALTRGLDVLLFSDNVDLADEIDLKRRARSIGRLVMGPGAGTAVLAGVGLGFSNRVTSGPVGVVAAAGTGAQEVMTLLDRWGSGVSHAIGVGGRDLSAAVGGAMAEAAIEALDRHEGTELTLLVSKPPAAEVAERLLGASRSKPLVAALIGLDRPVDAAPGAAASSCSSLIDSLPGWRLTHRRHHFLRSHVADVLVKVPADTLRIERPIGAVAVELILGLLHDLRTGRTGPLAMRIQVVDIDQDGGMHAAQGLRAAQPTLGELASQHQRLAAHLQLAMPDIPVRHLQQQTLFEAECVDQELDRRLGIRVVEIWQDSLAALRWILNHVRAFRVCSWSVRVGVSPRLRSSAPALPSTPPASRRGCAA